jgi:broad specificity phosphatase PhoE
MILDLIFVRHGQSCANVLSHIKVGIELFYPDPELTQAGIDTSKALSASLIKNVKKRWQDEPFSIGASRMIRAQETAFHMMASTLNMPINIIPHVGELGIVTSNYSIPVDEQIAFFKTKEPAIIDLLLKGKDAREPQNMWDKSDMYKFLKWAPEHPEFFELGSDGHYRAVIFTHSHFLLKAFNMTFVINNNDAMHSVIDTSKTVRRYEYWPLNREKVDLTLPHKCRITKITGKAGGGKNRRKTQRSRKLFFGLL